MPSQQNQNPIIIDTSGLYALIDRNDPHHASAAAFFKRYARERTLLLSNHVFDEVMTLAKVRLGQHVAVQLGLRLRNSSLIERVTFTELDEQRTWQIFTRYADKDWSYTDCACLALAQARGAGEAFTFDHHFRQMGLIMRP